MQRVFQRGVTELKKSSKPDLYSALKEYSESNNYPLHMPGHKRNTKMLNGGLPYDIDITEIDGFDNLHNANGILKRTAQKAEKIFHSSHAYMLINGSTCGILAAISCTAHRGDCIIAARNCHKSVYNACFLSELDIRFVYPPTESSGICGSISPDSVAAAIEENPNAKAVIITSPTYEGVISDIKSIAEVCHARKIPLITDCAHGAHLPFCTFGQTGEPVSCGADIVITSLHKTLPSLTQTAAAFVNGDLISSERFEKYLGIFETSSPSYVLMASIDRCFDFLSDSESKFEQYEQLLFRFSEKMKELRRLKVLCHGGDTPENHGFFDFDKGKIVILTGDTNISGVELMRIIREKYSLELEMSYPTYALAMTSVCDAPSGLERLAHALTEIDKTLAYAPSSAAFPPLPEPMNLRITNAELEALPDAELTLYAAKEGTYISRRCIYAYPPGIPIVIPGEIIGASEYEYIERLKKSGVIVEER